jgi:hypothetical protein
MLLGLPSSRTASLSNIPLRVSSPVMPLVMFTSYCFVFSSLQTLCLICVTFLASNALFFIILQTLFAKIPGVGIPKPHPGQLSPAFTSLP